MKDLFKKKWFLVTAVGIALLGAGAVGFGAAYVYIQEQGEHRVFAGDKEYHDDDKSDSALAKANPKLSFKEAADKTLAEAKSGIITKIELKVDNSQVYYEVDIQDNDIEKEYELNADTGKVLSTKTEQLDAQDKLSGTAKKTFEEVEKAVLAKYSSAKLTEIKLYNDGQTVTYKVEIMDNNQDKDLTVNSQDLTITEQSDKD
ncbi:MAG: PepSY domain-containing protein [Streptococcus orisratti]|uniref:PepSY domain-containing protein n=1 Tax=Streptococcus orisratti TaxID=114652 RepID=UPI002355C8D3|nr:PepSY domain-containing protein [Streptococcus orisratti]MCI7676738.1 PepSY domain-containing protein [Streptococcus orisratti]